MFTIGFLFGLIVMAIVLFFVLLYIKPATINKFQASLRSGVQRQTDKWKDQP